MSGDLMSTVLPLGSEKTTCPCCRRTLQKPRLLQCLHSICADCLTKVEQVLLFLEYRRGLTSSPSKLTHHPMGWFLCPDCHTSHLIFSPLPSPRMSSPWEMVMRDIRWKEDIILREKEKREQEEISGYVLNRTRGDGKIHLWDELQLEQHKKDLNHLLMKKMQLLNLKKRLGSQATGYYIHSDDRDKNAQLDGSESTQQVDRVLEELEQITTSYISTRETVPPNNLNPSKNFQSHPLTHTIPCSHLSYALLDRELYEKVVCTIPLALLDWAGNPIPPSLCNPSLDLEVVMKQDERELVVHVCRGETSGYCLEVTPPKAGLASLSVKLGGNHMRNSPYVLRVRELNLDELSCNSVVVMSKNSRTGVGTKSMGQVTQLSL